MTLKEYLEGYDLNENYQRNQYEKNKKIYKTSKDKDEKTNYANYVKSFNKEKDSNFVVDTGEIENLLNNLAIAIKNIQIEEATKAIKEINRTILKAKKRISQLSSTKYRMTKQNKWKVPDGPKEEREENNKKEIEHLTRVIEDLEEKKASWEKGLKDLQQN